MDFFTHFLDLLLHFDKQLNMIASQYGSWTYALLFLIIFCETGLVVTPFLPGDSLLFAAGALAASVSSSLNVALLFVLLVIAAVGGDTFNYWVGHYVGAQVYKREPTRWINKDYLDRTHRFYAKYGGKTIILARFIPILRTFAPFVAGIGSMQYHQFISYNVLGGLAWITLFLFGGYFFGNLPVVQQNFGLVIVAIIVISLLPPLLEVVRQRHNRRSAS